MNDGHVPTAFGGGPNSGASIFDPTDGRSDANSCREYTTKNQHIVNGAVPEFLMLVASNHRRNRHLDRYMGTA